MPTANNNPLDPERYNSLVRAALDPDERKFFKEHLGQESPDIMDYLLPQGRFARARDLREHINQQVLTSAIGLNPMQGQPTVGQALDINPRFPIPSQAISRPQVELQGPGAPVRTDITPGEGYTPEDYAIREDDLARLLKTRSRPFYEEGPRPTGPGEPVVDRDMLLPPIYQAALGKDINLRGLRGLNPYQAARGGLLNRWMELQEGADPTHPGEAEAIATALGFYKKGDLPVAPGAQPTDKDRYNKARADKMESDAELARKGLPGKLEKQGADLAKTKATTPLPGMAQAMLDNVLQRTELMKTQRGAITPAMDRFNKQLEAVKTIKVMEMADDESLATMLKEVVKRNFSGLQAEGHDMSHFGGIFGQTPGIKVTPKALTPPTQPEIEAPVTGMTKGINAPPKVRALFLSLKEGEVGEVDGVKYIKKGLKLERVP